VDVPEAGRVALKRMWLAVALGAGGNDTAEAVVSLERRLSARANCGRPGPVSAAPRQANSAVVLRFTHWPGSRHRRST
jgi:hypothetical protein